MNIPVHLIADESKSLQGFSFQAEGIIIYVLTDITYHILSPRRGHEYQCSGKMYYQKPPSTKMIMIDNWVDMFYQIPINAEYHPVGEKWKTAPRYKKRHTTIIAMPAFRGFGGVVERKSGGTQQVRQTFATPATLTVQNGKSKYVIKTAFYCKLTIDKNKVSNSWSRGWAVGFTTDLINSKDKPTHWGVVINGGSRLVKPK